MPIITKSSIEKGTPSILTLNKNTLAAYVQDAYFQDQSHWKSVVIIFNSSTGNQTKKVTFDATQLNPTGEFIATEKSLSEFVVEEINIYDFDDGHYLVPYQSLPAEEFAISLPPLLLMEDGYCLTYEDGSFIKL